MVIINDMSQHRWDVTPKEAIAIQQALREQVITVDEFNDFRMVAGIDVGFAAKQDGMPKLARAAVVVMRLPELEIIESVVAYRDVSFPYVPGLLSFREAPVILDALKELKQMPELLICDGQGLAHPRRFGLACHLGVLYGLPTIGAAKSRLIGEHADLGNERGEWQPLLDGGEVIGAALRTRAGAKPIFVSVGHRVSLETAIDLVMCCTRNYRIPEPTRLAHQIASMKD